VKVPAEVNQVPLGHIGQAAEEFEILGSSLDFLRRLPLRLAGFGGLDSR
jgi:hypothetical protein